MSTEATRETEITCTVNGTAHKLRVLPMARLLDVLREGGLTGTKEGCGEGECGACTVLLDGAPVCACLVPMLQLQGRKVTTIEGLRQGEELEPLQRAFIDQAGVQCGACTPGMIVTARALCARIPRPTRDEVREHLAGNLCRCTGYQAIFRAIEEAQGS